MGILGAIKQRVTDANAKAKADMAKVRDEWHSDSARHREDMAQAKERARVKDSEGPAQ